MTVKPEQILRKVVQAYRIALGDNFVALTLQTNFRVVYNDIDYAILVRRLDAKSYKSIARINQRFERKFGITLDLFPYEVGSFREALNPWSVEIVRRNTKGVYGKNFWDTISSTPTKIFRGAAVYLASNNEKFLRYIKNIGRQKREWIVAWALDHLFVAIKVHNSLFGFWSLGKERNLSELKQITPSIARRVQMIYQSYRSGTVKDPIRYLAQCYALTERIAVRAGKRTLRQFMRTHKKKPAIR